MNNIFDAEKVFTKQNVATTATAAVGLGLTAWHVATLKTTSVAVVKTSATAGKILMTTAKAGLASKIIVGGLCIGATALAANLVYDLTKNK